MNAEQEGKLREKKIKLYASQTSAYIFGIRHYFVECILNDLPLWSLALSECFYY